jgi:hypothetical protein
LVFELPVFGVKFADGEFFVKFSEDRGVGLVGRRELLGLLREGGGDFALGQLIVIGFIIGLLELV